MVLLLHSVMLMNDSVISIRRGTFDDVDALFHMETACFNDPWTRDYFLNLIHNPCVCFYIVTKDGSPVGYAGITVILDECEILNVAVMPKHRKEGLGRLLMNNIIEEGKDAGVCSFFLEHRESNIPAAALYSSLGFEEYDKRRNYYSSPTEDAVLRKLTL